MTLHDRIMGLELTNEDSDFDAGYCLGVKDAAKFAQEADELMAEMGNALASIDPDDLPRRIKGRVALAINHYNTYKEKK